MNPVKKRVFLCACLCALCVEASASPAQVFLSRLRQIAESGRFVYSWTNPWRPADPAFRVQEEGGWTSEGKECFKRFLRRPEVVILCGGIPSADSESE